MICLPYREGSFISNQFNSNNLKVVDEVLDREGRTNDFRTCPGVSLEPDSYGASVRPLLVDNQSSPWQSVAADDPNSIGGPPDLRETGESRTNPWSEFISPNAATKNLNDIAGTTSERLPDHCPTCSANLELRDRTHGIILSTCMFCHTERPRQVNASLENMPTTWSPPVRVLTATLLSGNTPKQTRSRSPSPSHPESSYRHRSHSLSLTDSDFDVIEDPYKPYHYWKKNSKNEKYREEWKTIHRKFCKKRRRMEQMKDVV